MDLKEAEKRACEWFENLEEELKTTGREATEDEIGMMSLHVSLCQTHNVVNANGMVGIPASKLHLLNKSAPS